MQRIDLLIIGALVLAAAGSALGVVTYEDDRRAEFRVAWTTSEVAIEVPVEGGGTGGGETQGSIDVAELNVSRAVWTATVTGAPARAQAIPIRIEAIAPDNTSASAEGELPAGPGASAEVTVEVDLMPVPTQEGVAAPTLDAARAQLAAATATRNGTGTWTILVSIGDPGPLGAAETIELRLEGTVTTYAATVSSAAPEVSRG